jgi:hypothetical protein
VEFPLQVAHLTHFYSSGVSAAVVACRFLVSTLDSLSIHPPSVLWIPSFHSHHFSISSHTHTHVFSPRYPLYDFLRLHLTIIQLTFSRTYHSVKVYFLFGAFYSNSQNICFFFSQENCCIVYKTRSKSFGHLDISTSRQSI